MPYAAARTATRDEDAGRYQRHRPEQTLLYRIVDEYYPVFTAHLVEQGRELPAYVRREFEDYLKCGRLEHGFLRVRCESCHATHLVKKTGHTHDAAKTGAVTLIQRFGSALLLNIHFHMLFLDGVYVERPNGTARFRWVKAPTGQELTQLAHTIAHRVGRFLERQGLLERDVENSYLSGDAVDDDPMTPLLGHSITYRIALGPQAGRKVFTPQTLPASDEPFDDGVGKVAGFSLHAGVAARADERKKLERLSEGGPAGTSAAQRCRKNGCR